MNSTRRAFAYLPACLIVSSLSAYAQTVPPIDDIPTELDAVTTTATRSSAAVKDVAGTVTIIDQRQIDRQNAQDIRDLQRYEPGISIGNNPTRTGTTSFVIRGIG